MAAKPTNAYYIGYRSLRRVCPHLSADRARKLAGVLGPAMRKNGITTPKRAAAFIAQIAHESDGFRTTREYADGSAYDKAKNPRLAKALGNHQFGDGKRFRGRGFIQITGRANYAAVSQALGVDFVSKPYRLESLTFAAKASAWWWRAHGCNELADRGDFLALTRRINGGTNGLGDRMHLHNRARRYARWLVPRA